MAWENRRHCCHSKTTNKLVASQQEPSKNLRHRLASACWLVPATRRQRTKQAPSWATAAMNSTIILVSPPETAPEHPASQPQNGQVMTRACVTQRTACSARLVRGEAASSQSSSSSSPASCFTGASGWPSASSCAPSGTSIVRSMVSRGAAGASPDSPLLPVKGICHITYLQQP